ncbi:hypothetical protein B7R54_04695 [Subtercola boreus]|uniref:Uncharacterized protein n=1 Tax=Subtercola boreus TaxID=120213 RepID=A0A3E0VF91_9MICO|nr:DUF6412 domain-containing protein [Subtercola boreus]RFA08604.1 hypothetical protein B7R54_04695 [Subtercola boreus]TQL54459.1 hypothetical protein FB464_1998 [Subtercola boreus]
MIAVVLAALQFVGALASGDVGSPLVLVASLLGAASVLLVVAVVLVSRWAHTVPDARGRPAPTGNADLPALITQSNPDAPGHARPRAPGFVTRRAA